MVNNAKNSDFTLAVANLAAAAMGANPSLSMDAAVRAARETLTMHAAATPQQIRDSVKNDKIQCLEDGTWHIMLRRYLMRRFALTPEQYRKKWGLPDSYPMVAPAYTSRRSKIAKKTGLGKHKGKK